MDTLTRPIQVAIDRTEPAYRYKTAVAYLVLTVLFGADAVRYSTGWLGWVIALGLGFVGVVGYLVRFRPTATLRRVPWLLWALLGYMALSITWSNYPGFTVAGTAAQLVTTLAALFFVAAFSWRDLLRLIANTLRALLLASAVIEVWAAVVVRGPIAPLVPNPMGANLSLGAAQWVQGDLLTGGRIQGIVGNANLVGYLAMVGAILFAVQWAVDATHRWLSIASFALALGIMVLSRSASILFAVIAVIMAATVSLIAEGRAQEFRHRLYRLTLVGLFLAVFFVLQYRETIFEAIGKAPDASGRGEIWYAVFRLIRQRPIEGWGWISYWMPGAKPLDHLIRVEGVQIYSAHNAYFDTWMQLGLIGLLLLLVLLVRTFIKIWQLGVRHTSPLYLWPLLVMVGILVQNLTESRMLIENGWMLLVILMVKVNEPDESLEPRGRSPKIARVPIARRWRPKQISR